MVRTVALARCSSQTATVPRCQRRARGREDAP